MILHALIEEVLIVQDVRLQLGHLVILALLQVLATRLQTQVRHYLVPILMLKLQSLGGLLDGPSSAGGINHIARPIVIPLLQPAGELVALLQVL